MIYTCGFSGLLVCPLHLRLCTHSFTPCPFGHTAKPPRPFSEIRVEAFLIPTITFCSYHMDLSPAGAVTKLPSLLTIGVSACTLNTLNLVLKSRFSRLLPYWNIVLQGSFRVFTSTSLRLQRLEFWVFVMSSGHLFHCSILSQQPGSSLLYLCRPQLYWSFLSGQTQNVLNQFAGGFILDSHPRSG